MLSAQILPVDGYGSRPGLALDFGEDESAVVRAQDGSSLTDAGCADVLGHRLAGVGNVDSCQLVGVEELHLLVVFVVEQFHKLLVALDVDGTELLGTRQDALFDEGVVHLVVDTTEPLGVVCQSEAHRSHLGYEVQG